MQNEHIDPKEKEKIIRDLEWWLIELKDLNDIDMLYELTDLKTDWEMQRKKDENTAGHEE